MRCTVKFTSRDAKFLLMCYNIGMITNSWQPESTLLVDMNSSAASFCIM